MEVSGELMLGRFSTHKPNSGGSESSDLSDDDRQRPESGGAIARYPESSTGLSDNDWNPYATESDTNQTPRSPRSNNSDDQNKVGFVSKASISLAGGTKPKESVASVSMRTGEVSVRDKNQEEDKKNGEKLDILRYVIDGGKDADSKYGMNRKSPDAGSEFTEKTLSARQSLESGKTETSGTLSGRPSSEYELDGYRRESGESGTAISGRSTQSEQGRDSAGSYSSGQSGQSQGSQKSDGGSSKRTDRSERLDKLQQNAGSNIKELIQFESSQRPSSDEDKLTDQDMVQTSESADRVSRRDGSSESVSRTRLTARLEPYAGPVKSSRSPDRSTSAAKSEDRTTDRYISVSERERLLSESPDMARLLPRHKHQDQFESGADHHASGDGMEREQPDYSKVKVPKSVDIVTMRSPSEVSIRRVSNLFEETKRQAREAVQLPRPEPSGSEERFPLKERLTVTKHERDGDRLRHDREAQVVRSQNSEEVARLLGKYNETKPKGGEKLVSAFDPVAESGAGASGGEMARERMSDPHTADESDDEVARRVRAILSQTDHLGPSYVPRGSEYVPRTIDYSRLQQDLQEIQDSLQDAPQPAANDSMALLRGRHVGAAEEKDNRSPSDVQDPRLSLEMTGTTIGGRESGVSEYGRRLMWDHGADLQYDQGYDGHFLGTATSRDTMSSRLRRTGDTDTLTVRPDSAATNDTDLTDLEGTCTNTLTGNDLTRAEKIMEQVMSRRSEGNLKESVEDIIARYRNERHDLFERFETENRASTAVKYDGDVQPKRQPRTPLADPDIMLHGVNQAGDASGPTHGKQQRGLAERVYKILTGEKDRDDSDSSQDKGMAKKVYKILASDRPEEQVNGILTETMEEEHEMLKKLVSRPKEDSSLEDSGLNQTGNSFAPSDEDVRKQLEYSLFSSPGKGDKSEFTALREVTSAPYSSLSNAKSLLSTQLQKMSERNFDKSVELRTPYRQTINAYPVYGVDGTLGNTRGRDTDAGTRGRDWEPEEEVREAWMPARRAAGSRSHSSRSSDKALDR